MSITAIKQAVEALTDSVDLVRNEYQDAVDLYGCYPTRAARINGLLSGLKAHEDAITALRTAIQEAESVKPVAWDIEESVLAIHRIVKSAASFSTKEDALRSELKSVFLAGRAQPAPKQEPVPAGYQLVPVEPTDKMVQASLHLDLSYMPLQEGYDRAAIYKAMLEVAPTPAQPAKP
jgi:hypothetical protein